MSLFRVTDLNETVTVGDFQTMLSYAQQHHLARFTFWSTNRDRPCSGGGSDSCSGVSQQAWDMWLEHLKMIINEYRLSPATKEAQEIIEQQMDEFFFGEGAALPPGYVPPQKKA